MIMLLSFVLKGLKVRMIYIALYLNLSSPYRRLLIIKIITTTTTTTTTIIIIMFSV